jgi:hypothetical protein
VVVGEDVRAGGDGLGGRFGGRFAGHGWGPPPRVLLDYLN